MYNSQEEGENMRKNVSIVKYIGRPRSEKLFFLQSVSSAGSFQ